MAIHCIDHPPATFERQQREPTQTELDALPTVLQHFRNLKDLPISDTESEKRAELSEKERFWLSEECLRRFIRATKGHAPAAIGRLEKTLVWRRTHKVGDLSGEHISPEQETGKQLVFGFDNHGRPLYYMFPSRQNTEQSFRQVEHVFFFLWLCEMLMPRGVETLALMINFADRAAHPNLGTAKTVLFSLQDHYPERLGKAHVIHLPFLVKGFFKVISPFIDPATREKLSFDKDCSKEVAVEQLERQFGGQCDLSKDAYEHESYWMGEQGVVTLARAREAKMMDKWRQLGGTVGLKEWDVKEGEESWTWPPQRQS